MRLVLLSDTHGFHRGMRSIPEGDVFIFAGDFSRDFGSWLDTVRFAKWIKKLPHAHKLLCPGNHDYAMQEHPQRSKDLFRKCGVTMLGQETVRINGISFDGGPWMPVSGYDPPWAFEKPVDELQRLWSRIDHVDVLVTHSPPAGILDGGIGCPVLRKHVERIRPQIHCFGHVHEERGTLEQNGILFLNISSNSRGIYRREDNYTVMSISIYDPVVHDLKTRGENVFDALAQSVIELSDKEIADEYLEEGETLDEVASRVREVLVTATKESIFKAIESVEFDVRLSVVSGVRSFLQVVRDQSEFHDLLTNSVEEIEGRLEDVLQNCGDVHYLHPKDIAISTYLVALAELTPRRLGDLSRKVIETPNTGWSRMIALEIESRLHAPAD